jgi:hypothetical protein
LQYSTIAGGRNNTAGFPGSFVGGGEVNNAITGGIVSGNNNTADGTSFIIGVNSNTSAFGALAHSSKANGYLRGQRAHGGATSFNSNPFETQFSELWASGYFDQSITGFPLSSGASRDLALDGLGTLIIPAGTNRLWTVQLNWIASVKGINGTATGVNIGDVISGSDFLCLKKLGGVSSLVGTVSSNFLVSDTSMSTATITYAIGGSQNLQITFTAPTFSGGGSLNIIAGCVIFLSEITI